VRHSSLHAAVPPRPSLRCCDDFNVNARLDSFFESQVALMRMELLQLVDVRMEEASRPLREEVATLKLLWHVLVILWRLRRHVLLVALCLPRAGFFST
jgi:hypothetical protein